MVCRGRPAFVLIVLLAILFYSPAVAAPSELSVKGFFEAAFGGEYADRNRGSIIRWEDPIVFYMSGAYTGEDIRVLAALMFDLAEHVNNLPQMMLSNKPDGANAVMSFVKEDSMGDAVTGYRVGNNGFVWVNYDLFVIRNAQIAIRSDIRQNARSAVIREEVVNMLGLLNDITCTRKSIICQQGKTVSDLSTTDYEMLNLLYSKDMLPGTTEKQAARILGD